MTPELRVAAMARQSGLEVVLSSITGRDWHVALLRRNETDPIAWIAFAARGSGALTSLGNVGTPNADSVGSPVMSDLRLVDVLGQWMDLGLIQVLFSTPAPGVMRLRLRTRGGDALGDLESAVIRRRGTPIGGLLEGLRQRTRGVRFGRAPKVR